MCVPFFDILQPVSLASLPCRPGSLEKQRHSGLGVLLEASGLGTRR